MVDDWPVAGIAGTVVAIVAAALLLGSCAKDYASSTPQVVEVMICDKAFYPAHTDTHCSTDDKGFVSCSTTYYPPSWSVEYADAERHSLNVSQGTYDMLRIGDKKVLRFDLGGGFWHARYNEQFVFGALNAEGSWPTR